MAGLNKGREICRNFTISTNRLAVMTICTKYLFGKSEDPYIQSNLKQITQIHQRSTPFYVSVSLAKSRIAPKQTAVDVGFAAYQQIKNNGYVLLLDDERISDQVDSKLDYCVTARSVEAAQAVVKHLGLPKCVLFDYYLGNCSAEGGYVFANWLYEQFKEYVEKNGPQALSQFEFDYRIHSQHENARKMITPIAEKIIDMVYRN